MATRRWIIKLVLTALIAVYVVTFFVRQNSARRNGELFSAVWKGDTPRLNLLLTRGCNANARLPDGGMSFLMVAADRGQSEVVATLLDHGADVNARTPDGKTALMFAAMANKPIPGQRPQEGGEAHPQVVKLLLERGADANAKDDKGNTALRTAQSTGHPDVVAMLNRAGARN